METTTSNFFMWHSTFQFSFTWSTWLKSLRNRRHFVSKWRHIRYTFVGTTRGRIDQITRWHLFSIVSQDYIQILRILQSIFHSSQLILILCCDNQKLLSINYTFSAHILHFRPFFHVVDTTYTHLLEQSSDELFTSSTATSYEIQYSLYFA